MKANPHEAAAAAASGEAVGRPTRQFGPCKRGDQQALLALPRARQGVGKTLTAAANQSRGVGAADGIGIPPGIHHLSARLPARLATGEKALPGSFRHWLYRLGAPLQRRERPVRELEPPMQHWHQAPAVGEDPRDGPAHGQRTGRVQWRRPKCPERTPGGRLTGITAPTARQRGQADPVGPPVAWR